MCPSVVRVDDVAEMGILPELARELGSWHGAGVAEAERVPYKGTRSRLLALVAAPSGRTAQHLDTAGIVTISLRNRLHLCQKH